MLYLVQLVTQAPEALLIRALKHAANGEFFTVVERVGLDNLTKERQLIRSTRENFEEDKNSTFVIRWIVNTRWSY